MSIICQPARQPLRALLKQQPEPLAAAASCAALVSKAAGECFWSLGQPALGGLGKLGREGGALLSLLLESSYGLMLKDAAQEPAAKYCYLWNL